MRSQAFCDKPFSRSSLEADQEHVSGEDRFWALRPLGLDTNLKGEVAIEDLADLTFRTGIAVTELAGVAVLNPTLEAKVAVSMLLSQCADMYQRLSRRLEELNHKSAPRHTRDPVACRNWTSLDDIEHQHFPLLLDLADGMSRADPLGEWPTWHLVTHHVVPTFRVCKEVLRRIRLQFGSQANRLEEMGSRDKRYEVFDDTRDYRLKEEGLNGDAAYLELFSQLRTQRDELDAIETFARVVAAEPELNPEELAQLSRIVADEARHVLIGELGIEALGKDPKSVSVGVIGALLRRELTPMDGLLQISKIGEAGNLPEIDRGASLAESLGYQEIAARLRQVYRDEMTHLKWGHKILSRLHPTPEGVDARKYALELTNRYLKGRGIPALSDDRQASKLLGE